MITESNAFLMSRAMAQEYFLSLFGYCQNSYRQNQYNRKHSGELFSETALSLKQNIVSGYEAKQSNVDNFLDNFRKWRK